MLIRYSDAATAPRSTRQGLAQAAHTVGPISGQIGVGFIGAGAFARAVLIPAFAKSPRIAFERVATAHGLTAFDAQRKFGFASIGTDPDEVIGDPKVQLVCILTRHDAHADLACRALAAGKHVFVEKPLALNEGELARVEQVARSSGSVLLVGFNRRFAPMSTSVRAAIADRGPIAMTYRINAGRLPPGHWLNDASAGGGRIIGEACHFVDLLSYLTGDAPITSVRARTAGRPRGAAEDVAIELTFGDGSVGQILYTALGAPGLGKERFEVHAGGVSAAVEDFRSGTIWRGSKRTALRDPGKGHAEEVQALVASVAAGGPAPIALDTLLAVTRATFAVHVDLRSS
jgi:predicted dehydrogenase